MWYDNDMSVLLVSVYMKAKWTRVVMFCKLLGTVAVDVETWIELKFNPGGPFWYWGQNWEFTFTFFHFVDI